MLQHVVFTYGFNLNVAKRLVAGLGLGTALWMLSVVRWRPAVLTLQAAALAGGFKERASMRGIYVIREGKANEDRQKAGLDTAVFPGDVVIVEESFF